MRRAWALIARQRITQLTPRFWRSIATFATADHGRSVSCTSRTSVCSSHFSEPGIFGYESWAIGSSGPAPRRVSIDGYYIEAAYLLTGETRNETGPPIILSGS
jgi:hypothetical protein